MHLTFRNVNDAFKGLVAGIHRGYIPTVRKPSRVGEVLMVPEPVTVTYTHPRERVLFNRARDANPFFHLFESLWMLAGRCDVAPLAYYNSQISDIASDDGRMFNGAYGYRWRYATASPDGPEENVDQLAVIINHLKQMPESRRVVLQMWNVEDDLLKINTTKDCCCNTHAYFSLRRSTVETTTEANKEYRTYQSKAYLDMTVCNRSNDMIWGMLGANVVHFSFLQEYLAACIGCEVGVYNQFTNNLHVYTERWEPEKWLADTTLDIYGDHVEIPLVENPERFDKECQRFVTDCTAGFEEPFLRLVAQPMMEAFRYHKERQYSEALTVARYIEATDWFRAANAWLVARKQAWEAKNA